ncbi:hypothetical protein AJ80_09636 [Polytolypa hystricis UAMH7299]|uniref:Uncharacterized protein n=1 Tax=Polytolypa hystricis (strain UAMH7299) TaxID=1447883 RepID=A0A2B7WMN6_POLH7|nr:hypothetical protein AJ80_09636 [Polytolypa hystricis UAMH7299]
MGGRLGRLVLPLAQPLAANGYKMEGRISSAIGALLRTASNLRYCFEMASFTNARFKKGNSLLDYRTAIGRREEMAIRTLEQVPKQFVMFYGPGAYQPTPKTKFAALKSYAQILKHILPSKPDLVTGTYGTKIFTALDLRDERAEAGVEFPLRVSEAEIAEIEADVKAAGIGIKVMNTIIGRLGDLWPEKGLIEHENYEVVMAMLQEIKGEFMEQCVRSAADKEVFEAFQPFDG